MTELPTEFPVALPPGWRIYSVDRKPFKGFEIDGPNSDFLLVYSHQPSPAGTFYRFLSALAHTVAPTKPEGACADWLRRFNLKHGRDPYTQEVWNAAVLTSLGEDDGTTPV